MCSRATRSSGAGPRTCPPTPAPLTPRPRAPVPSRLRRLGHQEASHAPFYLVIFPEGTIIREASWEQSKQYGAKNNLPVPNNMLVPR